jgi:hypothetical protein
MTSNRDRLGGFEERLLGELKSVVARRGAERTGLARDRTPLWRRPRVVTMASAGALAIGAAVGVPLLGGGSTTPSATAAFSVTSNDDGSVTATVNRLEDAEGLERQLEAYGIPVEVDYSPAGMECAQPRFTHAPSSRAVGFGFMASDDGSRHWIEAYVWPDRLRPGQTVVIQAGYWQAQPLDGGGQGMWAATAVADGPVKPCTLVPDDDNRLPRQAFPPDER